MKKVLFYILLVFLTQSCSENSTKDEAKDSAASYKEIPTDSVVLKDSVENSVELNKPTITDSLRSHVFKKGETLWELGTQYYGNRHYSSIISSFNNLNANKIEPGTIIKIPPMEQLFQIASPDSVKYNQAVTDLLKARATFMNSEKDLWDLRRETKFKGKQNLTEEMKENLFSAANLTDKANLSFKKSISDRSQYSKIKYQLDAVSSNLRELAEGRNDGYGYDLDMVHQNMNHALGYLLTLFNKERESATLIDSMQ